MRFISSSLSHFTPLVQEITISPPRSSDAGKGNGQNPTITLQSSYSTIPPIPASYGPFYSGSPAFGFRNSGVGFLGTTLTEVELQKNTRNVCTMIEKQTNKRRFCPSGSEMKYMNLTSGRAVNI